MRQLISPRFLRRSLAVVPLTAFLLAAIALTAVGAAAPQGAADLQIVKSDSPDPVRVGSNLTYTIGVENLGPSPATNVTVTDNLPRNVDLVSATGPAGNCAVQGSKVTCTIGSLKPVGVNYGGAQVTATVVVIPRREGTIRNTATVKGSEKDDSRGNNRATSTTRVLGAPSCRGVTATVTGTPGNDDLVGTGGPDVILALGGADRIVSRAGRDLICAGAGADFIDSGSAADLVFAGAGPDRLLGRGGPDLLKGSAGRDVLKGGRGADRLRGGSGSDRCRGGAGRDSIRSCER